MSKALREATDDVRYFAERRSRCDKKEEHEVEDQETPAAALSTIPGDAFFAFAAAPRPKSLEKGALESKADFQETFLHRRVGDASQPQSVGEAEGSAKRPRVICLFVDADGPWQERGFFKAIDALSASPREAFEKVRVHLPFLTPPSLSPSPALWLCCVARRSRRLESAAT